MEHNLSIIQIKTFVLIDLSTTIKLSIEKISLITLVII